MLSRNSRSSNVSLLPRGAGDARYPGQAFESRQTNSRLALAAGFSSYDGDLSLPLGLALGSPIFPSGCEGKLGVAHESLQGRRDLT